MQLVDTPLDPMEASREKATFRTLGHLVPRVLSGDKIAVCAAHLLASSQRHRKDD